MMTVHDATRSQVSLGSRNRAHLVIRPELGWKRRVRCAEHNDAVAFVSRANTFMVIIMCKWPICCTRMSTLYCVLMRQNRSGFGVSTG